MRSNTGGSVAAERWSSQMEDAPHAVPDNVSENIETVAQLQKVLGGRVNRHQRAVETATRWLGRPGTIYLLVTAVALWIGYNTAAIAHGWPTLDHPPFFWLQGTLTLYAVVVATTVLAAQKRQTRESEQRAHLELQVSLFAEQKATKIIALLEELRRDLPDVRNRPDPEADAMQVRADPRDVLSALESTMETPTAEQTERPRTDPEAEGSSR
jgi:uncharacterized membrane protein